MRPRLDLCANYPPAPTRNDAKRQQGKLARKLRRRGYRVNGNDTRHWVYVIELDDAVGPKTGAPDKPWLYVGSTSKPVEERIREHRDGVRNAKGPLFSKVAHRHFKRGRPDLYRDLEVTYLREDAIRLEAQVADALRHEGYSVHQA